MEEKIINNKKNFFWIALVLFLALGLRIILACKCRGFLTDVGCFYSWANRVFEGGFANFYAEDVFTDYPPGYMYVLYVVGALLHAFQSEYLSASCLLIVKLPAILCDLALGVTIYGLATKKCSEKKAAILAAFYLFNPTVCQNSVVWGQVDSVFVLSVVLMCVLLQKKKTIPAYFVYVIGVLLKPQTLVFTPLLLLGIYENVFSQGFDLKKTIKNFVGGLAAIGSMFLVCIPFGIDKILDLYVETLDSYPFVSVNAYNFWALLGKNWASQEDKFFGMMQYKHFGTLIIVVLCVLAGIIFLKLKEREERYWVTGAFIITTMFLFSVRMHERYLYPVMIFLLLAYVVNRNLIYMMIYIGMSIFHYLNVWHILNYYDPSNYDSGALSIRAISLGTVLVAAGFYWLIIGLIKNKFVAMEEEIDLFEKNPEGPKESIWVRYFGPVAPMKVDQGLKFTKMDVVYMVAITLFYGLFAFHNLGDTEVPHSEYHTQENENIMLNIPAGEKVAYIDCYSGHEAETNFALWKWRDDAEEWEFKQDIKFNDVYKWNQVTLDVPMDGYICLMADKERDICELVLRNEQKQVILPNNYSDFEAFFDEQNLYPDEISFMQGTYFDEIYYTITAYQMLNGLPTYEWTHPPFGKILMALGARIFGATPFGFRFMGTLLGCLMLPFMYLLGRNITKSREIGAFAAFIFAFDFMHFTQTRITTIDVFVTFFIILMYLFMEEYTRHNFNTEDLKATWKPLGACGIAFGFGIASKWTGFYAGAGLAVLFFATCFRRYREARYLYNSKDLSTKDLKKANKKEKSKNNKIETKIEAKIETQIKEKDFWSSKEGITFRNNFFKTCLFCVVFFIIIPATIYTMCYIPFRNDDTTMGLFARMIKNQSDMYYYHSGLEATHPYSSSWYDWPFMGRPILYYSGDLGNGIVRGISAFGNPLVWWMGVPAVIYGLYLMIRKQDRIAGVLCMGYLATYLPWTLVSRCTFIYHYFPSVPFLALLITYGIKVILDKPRKKQLFGKYTKPIIFIAYALAVFGLFILFYPVISGALVEREYVRETLKWFDRWVLVI